MTTPHVKRSPNPYMIYSAAERANVAATGLPNNMAVTKELGRRWNAFSDEERLPYLEEAKRLKAKHKQDHPDYKYQPKKKVKKADGSEKNKRSSGSSAAPYVIPKPKNEVEMPGASGIHQQQYPTMSSVNLQAPEHQFQQPVPQQLYNNYQPTLSPHLNRPASNGSSSSTPLGQLDYFQSQYGYEYHGLL